MRAFLLKRNKDTTGVSGTGYVAEGWQTSYGEVILRWYGPHGGLGIHKSMQDMLNIHGHGGNTEAEVVWTDGVRILR